MVLYINNDRLEFEKSVQYGTVFCNTISITVKGDLYVNSFKLKLLTQRTVLGEII